MNLLHKILFFILVMLMSLACSSNSSIDEKVNDVFEKPITKNEEVDLDTYADILEIVLQESLVEEKDIPDYELIDNKNNIDICLGEDLESLFGKTILPQFEPIELNYRLIQEIQAKADLTGDYLYIKIENIIISENEASVSIGNIWAISDYSQYQNTGGGGYILYLIKNSENWEINQNKEKLLWSFQRMTPSSLKL